MNSRIRPVAFNRKTVWLCIAGTSATLALLLASNLAAQAPPPPRPEPRPPGVPEGPAPAPVETPRDAADTKIVTGKVVRAAGGQLVIQASVTDDDRVVVHQRTFDVTTDTAIMVNKRPTTLGTLLPGDLVRVTVPKRDPLLALEITAARMVPDDAGAGTFRRDTTDRGPRREETQEIAIRDSGSPRDVIWHGKVFVAPLMPDSPAARAGFRPGDMVLFVDQDQALSTDAGGIVRGLRIIETDSRSGFVIDRPDRVRRSREGRAVPHSPAGDRQRRDPNQKRGDDEGGRDDGDVRQQGEEVTRDERHRGLDSQDTREARREPDVRRQAAQFRGTRRQ